jgi:hypothetical protein
MRSDSEAFDVNSRTRRNRVEPPASTTRCGSTCGAQPLEQLDGAHKQRVAQLFEIGARHRHNGVAKLDRRLVARPRARAWRARTRAAAAASCVAQTDARDSDRTRRRRASRRARRGARWWSRRHAAAARGGERGAAPVHNEHVCDTRVCSSTARVVGGNCDRLVDHVDELEAGERNARRTAARCASSKCAGTAVTARETVRSNAIRPMSFSLRTSMASNRSRAQKWRGSAVKQTARQRHRRRRHHSHRSICTRLRIRTWWRRARRRRLRPSSRLTSTTTLAGFTVPKASASLASWPT